MTTDSSSSDEMIRSAKESLNLNTEDVMSRVNEDLREQGNFPGDVSFSMKDEAPDEVSRAATTVARPSRASAKIDAMPTVRERRVAQPNANRVVVPPRKVSTVSVPVPPSAAASGNVTGSGRWMLIVGNVLLAFVIATWVILLIGLIDNPDDLGESIATGVVSTFVPFLFGVVLRRVGKRRGIAA